jgi:hypothetical protein
MFLGLNYSEFGLLVNFPIFEFRSRQSQIILLFKFSILKTTVSIKSKAIDGLIF